jgi:hypothetical protein
MSNTKLTYFAPHPKPTIKIRFKDFNVSIGSISLKRKYDNAFHSVIKEIMDNDGIVEVESRQVYSKEFKYDHQYILLDDLKTYIVDIFAENGFEVDLIDDNKL